MSDGENTRTDAELRCGRFRQPWMPCLPQIRDQFAKITALVLYTSASENSTEYMQRFLRLAGFLGQAAVQQKSMGAKNFRGSLKSILYHVMLYTVYGSDRQNGGSNYRNNNNNNHSRDNNMNSGAGRDQRNRGVVSSCAGTCVNGGQAGHLQRDSKKNTGASSSVMRQEARRISHVPLHTYSGSAANTSVPTLDQPDCFRISGRIFEEASRIPPIRDVEFNHMSLLPELSQSPKLLIAWHRLKLKELKDQLTGVFGSEVIRPMCISEHGVSPVLFVKKKDVTEVKRAVNFPRRAFRHSYMVIRILVESEASLRVEPKPNFHRSTARRNDGENLGNYSEN
ncbi:hypothetical protein Tco_0089874 [Tanacetum coccineum]